VVVATRARLHARWRAADISRRRVSRFVRRRRRVARRPGSGRVLGAVRTGPDCANGLDPICIDTACDEIKRSLSGFRYRIGAARVQNHGRSVLRSVEWR
jgi:hypothetical protein